MNTEHTKTEPAAAWEREIRALEDEARIAFLAADTDTLERLWAEELLVNSPLERVNDKRQVLELLRAGRIRHSTFEATIERMSRHGDVVVVMGRDAVADPPANTIAHRRYTNVWQRHDGGWRMIARHAQFTSDRA